MARAGATAERVTAWRALWQSFAALALGEAAARLFGLAAILLLARRLGPTEFGLVTLGTTIVAWFGLVADSGTELLNVRDVSRSPQQVRALCDRVLGLRLALSLPAAALFAGAAWAVGGSHHARSVLVLFALVLPATALNVRWMVLGVRGERPIAAGNVAAKAFLLVTVLVLVAGPGDVRRAPVLVAASELCYGLVIITVLTRRIGLILPRVDLGAWAATLRRGLPLMATSLVRAASFSVDVVAIAVLLGSRDVGLYGAASKPVLFATSLIGLFSVSFLAAYSSAYSSGAPGDADALLGRTVRLVVGSSLLAAAALSAGAAFILPLVFGHAYAAAVPVLALLAWRIPLSALGSPYATVLIARERQSLLLRNTLVGAALSVAGAFSLVPLLGMNGAASARLLAAVLTSWLNYRSTTRSGLAPALSLRSRPLVPDARPGR